ncbi:MAG TPA: hypothetical protein VHY22_09760, partial [Chthoniobacteraceae bacterium]|nr:hypothetical protein [Chthoniobacteraceae bacterium]
DTVIALDTVTGGNGGGVSANSTTATGNAGNGGTATSTSSATATGSSSGINVTDTAIGGSGGSVVATGGTATGSGGNGAAASSTASGSTTDGSTVSLPYGLNGASTGYPPQVAAIATGGAGGQGNGVSFGAGSGGAAIALASGTSSSGGAMNVVATAVGGAAGTVANGATGNNGGAATATANASSGLGIAMATATATGGLPTTASSNQGTANAGSDADGYAAFAQSSATGLSGSSMATASNSTGDGGFVDSITTISKAPTVSGDTSLTYSGVTVLQAAPNYTTYDTKQAAGYGAGSPTNVGNIISGAPLVQQYFNGPSWQNTFGIVDLGVGSLSATSSVAQTFETNVAFTINTAAIGGGLSEFGFIAGTGTSSGGFENIVLKITVGVSTQTYEFDSIADAEAFFNDTEFSLGDYPSEEALPIDFDMSLTSTGGGDEFDGELIFGAIPEPGAWAMLVAGAFLLPFAGRRPRRLR